MPELTPTQAQVDRYVENATHGRWTCPVCGGESEASDDATEAMGADPARVPRTWRSDPKQCRSCGGRWVDWYALIGVYCAPRMPIRASSLAKPAPDTVKAELLEQLRLCVAELARCRDAFTTIQQYWHVNQCLRVIAQAEPAIAKTEGEAASPEKPGEGEPQ